MHLFLPAAPFLQDFIGVHSAQYYMALPLILPYEVLRKEDIMFKCKWLVVIVGPGLSVSVLGPFRPDREKFFRE